MFGYVIINRDALSEAEFTRFRAHYCGLCRQLYTQYGLSGCATLSYDLTFLQLLLASLYEPEEERRTERCLLHPFKKHECVITPVNQVLKVASVLAGTLAAAQGGIRGWCAGLIVGGGYMALGIALYCAFEGTLLPISVIAGDLALGLISGFLSGLLASTMKSVRTS